MGLRKQQSIFVVMLGKLIRFATENGYELTLGDAFASSGHKEDSFHYRRLAIDLNLFKDGEYLKDSEDHRPLGEYWKSIGGSWGGDFSNVKDGNHYSLGEN